jgi:hypothetical protein
MARSLQERGNGPPTTELVRLLPGPVRASFGPVRGALLEAFWKQRSGALATSAVNCSANPSPRERHGD